MGRLQGMELDELELTDDVIRLRPWRATDAEDVLRLAQDRELHRFLPLPDPYTRADAEAFVGTGPGGPGIGDEGRAAGTGLGCAVVAVTDGRLLGAAALRIDVGGPDAAPGDAEIGYWVGAADRGRGVATRATRLLASWAFSVGVDRVLIWCDVANTASAGVALAAGLRYEGTGRGERPGIAPRADHPAGDFAHFARLATDPGDPIAPAFAIMSPGGLSDGTVLVRPARGDDVTALHETETDAESRRWDLAAEPRSAAALAAVVAEAGLQWLVGTTARCTIVDVASGAVAGSIDLRRVGPPQVASVGYAVHPAFRGRRYATRALRLTSAWAFGAGGQRRLELGAKVDNVASQRVALAAGFRAESVNRQRLRNGDGTFSDEAAFALLADDPRGPLE